MANLAVQIDQLSRFYKSGKNQITALDNITFELETGAQVALTGPSGSGKTTLLSLLGALEHPDSGQIILFGQNINLMNERQGADFRRHNVGFIFQDDALMPELTVFENIALPLILIKTTAKEIERRVQKILADLDLAKFSQSFPPSLSGGEKQRVAVARAVIHRPKLLLADEPTANLDRQAATLVLDAIDKLAVEYNLTMIMATHDPRVYNRLPTRLELIDGKLI
ncbi:ABC transporter ATP-binding protein [bacterium]|nr:ABC transporter ATP-binding protein [bacterium]